MAEIPSWLLNLVNAVGVYEDEHNKVDPGGFCLATQWLDIPGEVRDLARGYAQAKREDTDGPT
jgi:hypothetical protein